MVHEADAPRSRPCLLLRLPALQEEEMAANIRSGFNRGCRLLPPASLQSFLRRASRRLVRAEPSRRGLRRDVRRLADARPRMARALPRVESVAETGIRGRTDAVDCRQAAAASAEVSRRGLRLPQHQAQDPLRPQTKTLRGFLPTLLRQRPQTAFRRRTGRA